MSEEATKLKNGSTFLYDNKPFKVIKYSHVKLGRGGAIVRLRVRNILTGNVEEVTYSSNVKVESITTSKRRLQYLYCDEANSYFADPVSFEQQDIKNDLIEDERRYLKEGQIVEILFYEEIPLSIELPPKVSFTVSETAPGVKGNTASNVYKDAILDNGLKAKVPLFINHGDKVLIDTRNGEYVERVKKN